MIVLPLPKISQTRLSREGISERRTSPLANACVRGSGALPDESHQFGPRRAASEVRRGKVKDLPWAGRVTRRPHDLWSIRSAMLSFMSALRRSRSGLYERGSSLSPIGIGGLPNSSSHRS